MDISTVADCFTAHEIDILKTEFDGLTAQTIIVDLEGYRMLPTYYLEPLNLSAYDRSPVMPMPRRHELAWRKFQRPTGGEAYLAYISSIDRLCRLSR